MLKEGVKYNDIHMHIKLIKCLIYNIKNFYKMFFLI